MLESGAKAGVKGYGQECLSLAGAWTRAFAFGFAWTGEAPVATRVVSAVYFYLLGADYEVHGAGLIGGYGYGFFPGFWFGEKRAVYLLFG